MRLLLSLSLARTPNHSVLRAIDFEPLRAVLDDKAPSVSRPWQNAVREIEDAFVPDIVRTVPPTRMHFEIGLLPDFDEEDFQAALQHCINCH